MKDSQRYVKIVEWSELDGVYVGSAPDLFYGGCHGDDEVEVFRELCALVEDIIAGHHEDGSPLPPPTSGREVADSYPRMTRAPGANASQVADGPGGTAGPSSDNLIGKKSGKRAILSGEPDDDALDYQVKAVRRAVKDVEP